MSTEQPTVGRAAYTIDEICERSHSGRTKIYDEIKSGRLKTIKIGKSRRVTVEQERDWHAVLASSTEAA